MSREPLYPHVPKRREPLYPHRPGGSAAINWDLKRTDLPFYDNMLKDPDYYRRAKGVSGEIEHMSPQEYLRRSAVIFGTTLPKVYDAVYKPRVEKYADEMKMGDVFPIPVLDTDKKTQEGRHRVLAAEMLGAKTIPVLVVRSAEQAQVTMTASPVGWQAHLEGAERKALDNLSRYKFMMFGYWAAIWVHLNRISGLNKPNPFVELVKKARQMHPDADPEIKRGEQLALENDYSLSTNPEDKLFGRYHRPLPDEAY